jgi:hypothetical protein
MNYCELKPIEEVRTYGCEYCTQELKKAKQANQGHIWVNIDGHIAIDPSTLEDRAATNRKYGLE